MIKAAFFDVDGTLVPFGEQSMPDTTRQALFQLKENGIKVFVSTGRHPIMLSEVRALFPFDGFITLNGQIAFDESGFLRKAPIEPTTMRQIIDELAQEEAPVVVLEEEHVYGDRISDMMVEVLRGLGLPTPQIMSMDRAHHHNVFQVISAVDRTQEKQLLERIPGIEFVRWNEHFVDLVPKEGGKHKGLAAVMEKYGFNQDEVIAFGDGDNDKTMLDFAGIGVAMGNAENDVKVCANHVTTHILEQGIPNALKHFKLIET